MKNRERGRNGIWPWFGFSAVCVVGGGGGHFTTKCFWKKAKKGVISKLSGPGVPPTPSIHTPFLHTTPTIRIDHLPLHMSSSFFGFKCHGWGTIPNSTVFNRHKIENGFLHADLIRTRFHWWQLMELLFISTNTRPKKLTFLEKRRRFPLRVDCLLRKLAE
jgi:hypothetical protein